MNENPIIETVNKILSREGGTFKWWYVLIGDAAGNPIMKASGNGEQTYVLQYAAFRYPEEVIEHVRHNYCRTVDPKNFTQPLRAWASNEDPGILRPIPAKYVMYGTNRMHAEIEAGLREPTDFLLPPVEFDSVPPIVPSRGRGLPSPTRRRR